MAASYTQGTIVPKNPFSAEQAAGALRKAMKGLGTDEAKIIEVMSSHTNQQRQEIFTSFKTQFGKDLRSELKSEISGRFEDLVLALLETPVNYDARELKAAIKGAGTDEGALIEILCSRSNAQILAIKQAYKTLFKSDLEKDIMSDTSGHFKRLLVSQLAAGRDESGSVDPDTAAQDAKELFEAGANKLGTDESTFNRILSLRGYAQLKAVFEAYQQNHGKDIEAVIQAETSGYLEDGYLAIVRIAKNPPAYFAQRLHKSMKGAGTKDSTLIRVVASRSEVDMIQIKQEFQRLFGKTLGSFIKGDTSGDYKKLLLALCAEDYFQERRRHLRLIFLYKVVEGHVPAIDIDQFLKTQRHKRTIRAKRVEDYMNTNIVENSVNNTTKKRIVIIISFYVTHSRWNNFILSSINMASVHKEGTIVPKSRFSPEQAAVALRTAMKGLGTNEAEIVDVMSTHNNQQRQEILATFNSMLGRDLRADLKSELSGRFLDLVLALLELPVNYDAKELKAAIKGLGTDEDALIEILCSRSNAQILAIKKAYKILYQSDLENDIVGDTSGIFKRLLVTQLAAGRDESGTVDPAIAAQDAHDLNEAVTNKLDTDGTTFNRIFCLRSHRQLKADFDAYHISYGKEIEDVIRAETSGDLMEGYLAIVRIAKNPPAYFAELLYKSMKGVGTKDSTLIRVVVTRSEVDMVQIKHAFQRLYGKSLRSFIKGDTSGDYKKLLLALCGASK
ncbi:annexin A6-like [Mya arenaria]|uniref:annexin A6-like n=1 Tax=Mya arenaria TaxID=6604 RepID=UPI0022E580DE|nr:annexin A6-like [Mya arenaria]